tara:strand:- start:32446 stop:33402 length:957 start_codon:yes stop_codon:yes gene_type:complete
MRMSFVGGGSDLPNFYKNYKGAVVSTSINKYIYISLQNYFDSSRIKLKYSKLEEIDNTNSIKHPIIRSLLSHFNLNKGLEITSSADVPGGTGLGSSSTFTVGLIAAICKYLDLSYSKEKIAKLACHTEIEILKEPIGKQDQYAASFGGFNFIEFNKDGFVNVQKIKTTSSLVHTLESNLHLFYLGGIRSAKSILESQNNSLIEGQIIEGQNKMVKLAYKLRDSIESGDVDNFGHLLHENWMLKKTLSSQISSLEIDEVYNLGLKSGALGGKLLGAGGSGFMLFYCDQKNMKTLKSNLSEYRYFDFKFDVTGTKIIYSD